MRYIDKTQTPKADNFYPLYVIKQIIAAETGRVLNFMDSTDEFSGFKPALFTLVRFPDPVGFCLAANKTISAGKVLFSYGGEKLTEREALRRNRVDPSEEDTSAYLLNAHNEDVKSKLTALTQDAKNEGGFGALLAHLPSAELLDDIGLSQAHIQTANTQSFLRGVTLSGKSRICVVASTHIASGEIIGFDYGLNYFVERKVSPLFFVRGKTEIAQASIPNPRLVLLHPETASPRFPDVTSPVKSILMILKFMDCLEKSRGFAVDELSAVFSGGEKRVFFLTSKVLDIAAHYLVNPPILTTQSVGSQLPGYSQALFFVPSKSIENVVKNTAPPAQVKPPTA